jgi:xanthine dehydrogenase accessory factor
MIAWLDALCRACAETGGAVLITIAAARGSAPREPGTHMVVTPSSTHGSIGGGHLEFETIAIARDALGGGAKEPWLVRFPLAARLGQCCGGVATLLFQRVSAGDPWPSALAQRLQAGRPMALLVDVGEGTTRIVGDDDLPSLPPGLLEATRALLENAPAEPRLIVDGDRTSYVERIVDDDFHVVVFGNGHVGRALVQVLGALPCRVTWIDAREHDFPSTLPANVTVVATDDPESEVADPAPGACYVVTTHTHALDFALTEAILARADFAYLGMIGSRAKRAQLERHLSAHGVAAPALERITCPIGAGTAAVRSKHPGAIAVGVAAELLARREQSVGAAQERRARG